MSYFYQRQFKKHILQFMEIFRGLEIKTGKTRDGSIKTIEVPISYGSMDRVAAAITTGNTQNLPLRLPTMTAYMTSLDLASDRFKGIDTEKSMPYTPKGGVFPDDTKSISQIMPIPFKMGLDLHVYSNNFDTQMQILEQILVLFNPSLQIQISDALFDGSKITHVELKGISTEENFPIGTERRIITNTLAFETIVYLTAPSMIKNDRIKDIKIRISKLNDAATDVFEPGFEFDITDITVEQTLK